jgi:tetratricopeptide (TPR) repeat protein
VKRLVAYRILRYDEREKAYTAHPLVRNHYLALLTAGDPSTVSGQAAARDAHARIKDYYLELAGDVPQYPTLDDLAPLIEVVHHACRAGVYDEAWQVYWERIAQRDRFVVVHQLGAYESDLALILEFFPGGDAAQEPQISDPRAKSWILNAVGFRLMSLGRLGEAVRFYERAVAAYLAEDNWSYASIGYQNLAELHAALGALDASAEAAREALVLARRAENKGDERTSLAHQAWADHLRGDLETAAAAFQRVEKLEQEIDSTKRYAYRTDGIKHADHLRRTARSTGSRQAADYARRVSEANLDICEQARWPDDLSRSRRVLGDLDADEGHHDSAGAHYDQALKIARGITRRDVLIEALLARGRWAARHHSDLTGLRDLSGLEQAFADLNEALGYAVEGGYRIYEADTRVALAWARLASALRQAQGDFLARAEALRRAQDEAERARQMSVEMGYHWGQVDAAEVLAALESAR